MLFRSMDFNVDLIWMEEGRFWNFTPFDQEENTCPYCLREVMSKRRVNVITREPRFTNTNSSPYVDNFWKIHQMVKAWNDHTTSIFLAS